MRERGEVDPETRATRPRFGEANFELTFSKLTCYMDSVRVELPPQLQCRLNLKSRAPLAAWRDKIKPANIAFQISSGYGGLRGHVRAPARTEFEAHLNDARARRTCFGRTDTIIAKYWKAHLAHSHSVDIDSRLLDHPNECNNASPHEEQLGCLDGMRSSRVVDSSA